VLELTSFQLFFFAVVDELKEKLGANAVPLQIPIGAEDTFVGIVDLISNKAIIWDDSSKGMQYSEGPVPEDLLEIVDQYRTRLVEGCAEEDDALLEKFFEDHNSITEDEMRRIIRQATLEMKITPVICGSAFKNKGVQNLLDAICMYLPNPYDVPAVSGINPDTDKEEVRHIDSDEPFAALAFKIATDPFVGRIAFFRVYSGSLQSGSYVLNASTGKKERISRIMQMHANKQIPLEFIEAGDIGAAVGFKQIRTGDTLCDEKHPIILESMTFPEPVISVAIEPRTQDDVDKLDIALLKLAEEDPTFKIRTDQETGQTVISGMGELHLDILTDRLRREFKLEVNQGAPQVAYREAVTATVSHREVYKKQTGGKGKFADIIFELGPADEPEFKGLQFVNEVKGGNIPKEFIGPIEKGFKAAMSNGVMAGFALESMKVKLIDGSFHAVDSDALAFEICAKIGFKEAARKAKSVLLEPIMKIEVVCPDNYVGDVTGDLNKRRAVVENIDAKIKYQIVKAKVPLSEMFGYVTSLRTVTSGRGNSSMEFSHYQEVPKFIAEAVIEKIKG